MPICMDINIHDKVLQQNKKSDILPVKFLKLTYSIWLLRFPLFEHYQWMPVPNRKQPSLQLQINPFNDLQNLLG